MKIKTVVTVITLAMASSTAMADWDSASADATVTANVLNPLGVNAPASGSNDGALGKVEVNSVTSNQLLDFTVDATADYAVDLTASVTTPSCQDKDNIGPDGAVELTNTSWTVTPNTDTFDAPVEYTYYAPSVAKLGASCMVNLAAVYQ